jgi:hypothetical protein
MTIQKSKIEAYWPFWSVSREKWRKIWVNLKKQSQSRALPGNPKHEALNPKEMSK